MKMWQGQDIWAVRAANGEASDGGSAGGCDVGNLVSHKSAKSFEVVREVL